MGEPHPVERVVVFEDRAEVTRRVSLPSAPGRHHVRVGPLSPLIRQAALAFVAEGAVVESVSIHRERLSREDADGPAAQALQAELSALHAQRQAVEAALLADQGADARARARLEVARAWSGQALQEQDDAVAWVAAVRALADEASASVGHRAALEADLIALSAEIDALRQRLQLARGGASVLRAWLDLTVRISGEDPQLRVRTVLPCAAWRPIHQASLTGARLAWETGAMVWNATGEAWAGVELVCSTARASTPAAPPTLTDDRIETRPRDKEVVVQARDEAVVQARVGAAREAGEVPGVADGGEARTFTARHRVSLPSDGQPVMVALESWEADAEIGWFAHPERDALVVRRSRQTNGGTRPILAGPVQLRVDGLAVGRGRVGLVPPGEPFHLDWGSHDGLRVHRAVETTTERGRIMGGQVQERSVSVRVHSEAEAGVIVQVVERIAVSELKEVSVKLGAVEPAVQAGPDADGLITWRVGVQPGETRVLKLVWRLEAPSHVRLPEG